MTDAVDLIDDLSCHLNVMADNLAEAAAMLRRLEWAHQDACFICDKINPRHRPGCELAALLKRLEKV